METEHSSSAVSSSTPAFTETVLRASDRASVRRLQPARLYRHPTGAEEVAFERQPGDQLTASPLSGPALVCQYPCTSTIGWVQTRRKTGGHPASSASIRRWTSSKPSS